MFVYLELARLLMLRLKPVLDAVSHEVLEDDLKEDFDAEDIGSPTAAPKEVRVAAARSPAAAAGALYDVLVSSPSPNP